MGITSGKDDSGSKPDNKAQVGKKHKKTINTKVRVAAAPKESRKKRAKPTVINPDSDESTEDAETPISLRPKAPQKKQTKRTNIVNSDVEPMEDEGISHQEGRDEVDAYERLREQRETDRPVSSGTYHLI